MARQVGNGNTFTEAREYTQQLVRLVEQLQRWERVVVEEGVTGAELRDIRVKPPKEGGNEWLVIVRMDYEGEPMVAFSNGTSLLEALRLMSTRWLNGDLKWKEDQYGNR